MPTKGFWIAAAASVLATVGLAVGVAKLWGGEGGVAGAGSGAFLGSLLSVAGFGMLLGGRASSMGIFGIFFLVKILVLAGGAALFWKLPQLGRHEFFMGGFLGGALVASVVGALFLLRATSRTSPVSSSARSSVKEAGGV